MWACLPIRKCREPRRVVYFVAYLCAVIKQRGGANFFFISFSNTFIAPAGKVLHPSLTVEEKVVELWCSHVPLLLLLLSLFSSHSIFIPATKTLYTSISKLTRAITFPGPANGNSVIVFLSKKKKNDKLCFCKNCQYSFCTAEGWPIGSGFYFTLDLSMACILLCVAVSSKKLSPKQDLAKYACTYTGSCRLEACPAH